MRLVPIMRLMFCISVALIFELVFVLFLFFFLMIRPPPSSPLFPSTPLSRSGCGGGEDPPVSQVAARVNADEISVRAVDAALARSPNGSAPLTARAKREIVDKLIEQQLDRKSTRLNSSHLVISYAVFCLKKKK